LLHSSPLTRTSSAEEQLELAIAPSLCFRGGYFFGSKAKLTASRAAGAMEGISYGVGWLLWPSSDDLKAIGHGFGGRSMVDCCVLCVKKYGTFVRSSQKNKGPHQPPTLPQHRNL
jgi:hypothetical protein